MITKFLEKHTASKKNDELIIVQRDFLIKRFYDFHDIYLVINFVISRKIRIFIDDYLFKN